VTGNAQKVARPKPFKEWLLDHTGEPRLGITIEEGTSTVYYLDPATSAWRQIASFASYGKPADAFMPVGFGPDGTLYVTAHAGKDASSLHTFDFATGKISPQPVVATGRYDFDGTLVRNRSKLLGVSFTTDAESNEWFDPGMKAIQDKIDKLLPATVNLISVPAAADSPWMLVRSYSDVVPPMFTLYNRNSGAVNPVGSSQPAIKSSQMGPQQAVTFKARDGLEIPALLTLPRTGVRKNLPMVVLVHGGPWIRGSTWGWNQNSQFLASRGYAVLEPSFRGTTGHGQKHEMASWKQWGLSMQDDIADGTRWAIAQGIADPKRICIAGASYGGYATLMGLVKDPDLFKCGVNWVGVTDINLMYDDSWTYRSDMTDEWRKFGMPVRIGDKVKDAAQLKATSPIEQAARITQPLLMAYGGHDQRVPLHHGKKFLEAVQRSNKHVEWIEYPEEGHGWQLHKNKVDFWTRVEKFLGRHIGKP
jgi:dipeptidyl aminopeptidase/acylaminoacyl peptidase